MGAIFYYDEMLPTIEAQAKGKRNPKRQVEVFTHAQKLYLRIQAVDQRSAGAEEYTVRLSGKDARELIEGIEGGMSYLSL